jgi:hypothetical protein
MARRLLSRRIGRSSPCRELNVAVAGATDHHASVAQPESHEPFVVAVEIEPGHRNPLVENIFRRLTRSRGRPPQEGPRVSVIT